jgi:hypothetical protein
MQADYLDTLIDRQIHATRLHDGHGRSDKTGEDGVHWKNSRDLSGGTADKISMSLWMRGNEELISPLQSESMIDGLLTARWTRG